MRKRVHEFWGAHAFCVLAMASPQSRTFSGLVALKDHPSFQQKFVEAKCRDQHAPSVRFPDL
jgi:hypothetical protein